MLSTCCLDWKMKLTKISCKTKIYIIIWITEDVLYFINHLFDCLHSQKVFTTCNTRVCFLRTTHNSIISVAATITSIYSMRSTITTTKISNAGQQPDSIQIAWSHFTAICYTINHHNKNDHHQSLSQQQPIALLTRN